MMQHGEYSIENQGDIIRFTIKGLFNEFSIRSYSRELQDEISRQKGQFGLLEIALDYEGATPEAFEESNKFNEWLNSTLCVGKAIVIGNPFFYRVSENNQSSLKNQNVRIFKEESEARTWLNSLLR